MKAHRFSSAKSRTAILTLLLLGATVTLAAAPSLAQDRPDLVGGTISEWCAVIGPYYCYNCDFQCVTATAQNYSGEDQFRAKGLVVDPYEGGSILWQLYEPDTITRTKYIGRVGQRNYVAVGVASVTTSLGSSISAPMIAIDGCRARATVQDVNNDQGADRFFWTVLCPSDLLDQLGLSDTQKETFQKVFGSKTLRVSGRKFYDVYY